MSDDEKVCCVLGICCPDGSEKQRDALAAHLLTLEPRHAADWILDNFDLAPKDSLKAFKGEIVRMAKGGGKG